MNICLHDIAMYIEFVMYTHAYIIVSDIAGHYMTLRQIDSVTFYVLLIVATVGHLLR